MLALAAGKRRAFRGLVRARALSRSRWSARSPATDRLRVTDPTAVGARRSTCRSRCCSATLPRMTRDVRSVPKRRARAVDRRREHRRIARSPAVPADDRRQVLPDHHRRSHRRRPDQPRSDGGPLAGAGRGRRGQLERLRGLQRRSDGDGRARAGGAAERAGLGPARGRRGDHQHRRGRHRAASPTSGLSANWMAACGEPGEDADLYATVRAVGVELCAKLGITIPVGKDSLSMRTAWTDAQGAHSVIAPVSLIVSAFAPVVGCAPHADPGTRFVAALAPAADRPGCAARIAWADHAGRRCSSRPAASRPISTIRRCCASSLRLCAN